MKICFKCNIEKPLTEYYKHKQMTDGHLNKCKDCTKSDTKNASEKNLSTPENKLKEQARQREKYHRLKYREKHKPTKEMSIKAMNNYRIKFPEKYKAKIKSQRMIKPFVNAEAHHWSYNILDAKDVIWLSKKDHSTAHRFIVYDQERMMYRRCDTLVLLDTKESHEEWITHCINNNQN